MWCSHSGFKEIVHNIFHNSLELTRATSDFEEAISIWNKEVFGNIFQNKKQTLARLAGIQSSPHYPTSSFLQNLELSINHQFKDIPKHECIFWKLKSRINWLMERDSNTKFHTSTLNRRRRNKINSLQDDHGNWIHSTSPSSALSIDVLEDYDK